MYLWCIAHRLELAVLHAVKHDDYLSEFEDIISNIFLMYYLSPKLRQEFKVLGQQLDKITKESGGLKWVRWLASCFRAIFMLANNYKVLCFHLQNISNYGDTANAAKAEDLVPKIQILKICGLPTFLHGFASDFTKNVISISH